MGAPTVFDFKSTRRDVLLCLLFAVLTAALWRLPTGFEERGDQTALRARAHVIEVDDTLVQQYGMIRLGAQAVTMKIAEGPFTGRVVTGENLLTGKLELDKIFAPGDDALAVITRNELGEIGRVNPQDHYRLDTELWLLCLFAALLLAFGGFTGAKALLSFLFTALAIWKLLIPAMLRGHDPIYATLGLVTVITAAIIFLVGGMNRKGMVAFLGAMLGVAATCALALVFAPEFKLHGAIRPFSESLLYTGFAHLDLSRIFLAGIFLASAGAVMDLSMDVAAAQDEVVRAKPDIGFAGALRAGFAVGRAVTGTMTTTLLLAYSASYMTLLMVFMAQGVPMANLFNMSYVAAEVFNTLVGSFGLITVAPFTALAGAFLFTRGRQGA